jgi:hypothetical protein
MPVDAHQQQEPADGRKAAAKAFRARIRIHAGRYRRRGAGPSAGRFIVADDALGVRTAYVRWIPEQSASKAEVGRITVREILHVELPILHWRRRDVVRFGECTSELAAVSVTLSRRRKIVDQLRARGYAVTYEPFRGTRDG